MIGRLLQLLSSVQWLGIEQFWKGCYLGRHGTVKIQSGHLHPNLIFSIVLLVIIAGRQCSNGYRTRWLPRRPVFDSRSRQKQKVQFSDGLSLSCDKVVGNWDGARHYLHDLASLCTMITIILQAIYVRKYSITVTNGKKLISHCY